MSFDQPHRDSEAEMKAWSELMIEAEIFDNTAGNYEALVKAIDALIEARVAAALEEFADRVEQSSVVRP